jgi:hypothetical protein
MCSYTHIATNKNGDIMERNRKSQRVAIEAKSKLKGLNESGDDTSRKLLKVIGKAYAKLRKRIRRPASS